MEDMVDTDTVESTIMGRDQLMPTVVDSVEDLVAGVLEAEDMVEDIVARDLPMLMPMLGMDTEDMVDMDMVEFTIMERDQLMPTVVDSVEDLVDVDLEEE